MTALSGRRTCSQGALGGVISALALGVACGPSFEAIAEGDTRFAHCDRLDLDPNIAPSHRLHCWREWRRVYTYGQTRDRVEYAQRRIAEVVSGDTDPSFDLPSGQPRTLVSPKRVVPSPAGAPPPPPPPLEAVQAVVAPPVAAPVSCRERCEAEQRTCLVDCATRPTGCEPCGSVNESCRQQCESAQ